jgi:calcineurin-like phosphoesterase family protein
MGNIWFTSDFHFGHFNIVRYCNRPFTTSQEMDEMMAHRLNECVKPNDVLYFLGDFCLGRVEQVTAYRKRITCKTIHFIEGNHDKGTRKLQHLFASWGLLSEVHVAKQRIVLCHYAMRVWPHHAQGAWHLLHGISMDIRMAICPMNRFHSRSTLALIPMTFARGILKKSGAR